MHDSFISLRTIKRHELCYVNAIPTYLIKNYKIPGDEPIHITFGGDTVKILPNSSKSAIYTFMSIPLKKIYKPLPIQVMPTTNGSSGPEIVYLSKYITAIIEQNTRFVIDFIATDGDARFDSCHCNFFVIIEPILNLDIPFLEKIDKMASFIHIPVNDPLHLIKN